MTVQSKSLGRFKYTLVTTKTIFIITLMVMTLTILSVWLFGLGKHRSLYLNSILSCTILSVSFFLFLTIGLCKGIKLKDNLGKITNKIKFKFSDLSGKIDLPFDALDFADDITGIITGIIAWIVFSISILIFIWAVGPLFWSMILAFVAMLYWIFFRALRLVFKNSAKCKDNIAMSMVYAIAYTALYNFWIYGIILSAHYLNS